MDKLKPLRNVDVRGKRISQICFNRLDAMFRFLEMDGKLPTIEIYMNSVLKPS